MPIQVHCSAGNFDKVGRTKLALVCNQGSLVGQRMQDYKCLCEVVMIYVILVKI